MINMLLSEAASVTQAEVCGEDLRFTGCSTDSRTLRKNQLFIALRGERFDGHEFIDAAQKTGACAVMVDRNYHDVPDIPLLKVDDTRIALGNLARGWRQRFSIPLIAVTGSNGKTTVKEMLSAILSQQAAVLSTTGNFNNDIGLPLTLFGMSDNHDYAVIEMGANHAGEIARLTELAAPTVAVITLCAPAHLEGFGSIEGVAHAKAEIFQGLQDGGVAVINADDNYAGLWRNKAGAHKQISFALSTDADVVARQIQFDSLSNCSRFDLQTEEGTETVQLPLAGEHNVANALAATACCLAINLPLSVIKSGLESMSPVKGRLQLKKGKNQIRIIDDTYNANPTSLTAAIKVACSYPGRCWLALGDMAELGEAAESLHYEAGESAREAGVEKLFAVGQLSQQTVTGFGEGARHFSDIEQMISVLSTELAEGVNLLVKGSRSMAMEQVVSHLEQGES